MDKFLNKFVIELKASPVNEFIERYKDLDIECAYILDESGIQITNSSVFFPAVKGEDNSLKRYYYKLMNSKIYDYFLEPYISYATGEICITLSKIFTHNNYKKYILCIDIARD